MIRRRGRGRNSDDAASLAQTVDGTTVGGANVQVGGDVHGPIVIADVTVQNSVGSAEAELQTDIATSFEAAVDRYCRRNRSTRPGFMADHPGSAAVVERLCAVDSRQVLVVHGRAGIGKSSVITDAIDRLSGDGWFVGVVRMDALEQVSLSADDLGRALNLPSSPMQSLDEVDGDSPRVLFVDQLDAVSMYSGRMPDSYVAVMEMLERVQDHPRVRIVLTVRTVDLESDPRMRCLLADNANVDSLEIGDLEPEAVRAVLTAAGVDAQALDPETLELLRVPLHLAVFSHLDSDAHHLAYRTLPDLYEQFTRQTRQAAEVVAGGLDMSAIVSALVSYMSAHEVLMAPPAVLDAVPRRQVSALVSAGLLIEDASGVSFFHETYFDFHFARSFVAHGGDLYDFLVESGQQLFRRAQTRQVLEYLAAIDRRRFREVVAQLLDSSVLRAHLLDVVIGVLGQLDATADDWLTIESVAFGQSRRGARLIGLLSLPSWFDAADEAGRLEPLLADAAKPAVANQMVIAARERAERVSDLVRPHIGTTEAWDQRLRAMVEWSLRPGLVDLTVQLAELGVLDEARGPIAVNSDIWSIIYGVKDEDPVGAARVIGAVLRRALKRAQAANSPDPFSSGQLNEHSPSGSSIIANVAENAPDQFLIEVLPFLIDILLASSLPADQGEFRLCPRWSHRYVGSVPGVDDALFVGVETALRATAPVIFVGNSELIATLGASDLEPLRFLACRTYAAGADGCADEAIDWLLSDVRNLQLGWSDSPRWATRELIESATEHCDETRLASLCTTLVGYYPRWETTTDGRQARGYAQLELLTAVTPHRLPVDCAQRVAELQRKFPDRAPAAPRAVEAFFVGPPIPKHAASAMTDRDWAKAIAKHDGDQPDHSRPIDVGGPRELAALLGEQAKLEPERFARLALTFDSNTPTDHINQIIDAVAGEIPLALLTQLCMHAERIAGSAAGLTVCRAVATVASVADDTLVGLLSRYANDPDPDHEAARTPSYNGQLFYNGDLRMAGMNCTRGQAAEAISHVLFAQPRYADRLLPTVATLASDAIMAVQTQAALAIGALLNTHSNEALDLAHHLFSAPDIDIFDSKPAIRLLTYSVLRAPQRFAAHLTRALDGPEAVAEGAGHTWAVARTNDRLPPSVASTISALPSAACRGVASALAAAPATIPDLLVELFDHSDPSVRDAAAGAIRKLDHVDTATAQKLVASFTTSDAFTTHIDAVFHALEKSVQLLPEALLLACDRAIGIAGPELGDIRTSNAAVSPDMVAVVLRLYRQGNPETRKKCLDLIDRMSDVGAYGLEEALRRER